MESLRFAFDVRCAPEHAFDIWARRIDSWWPRDHTVGPAETVLLQPRLGGRIYERDAAGVEHDWGVVTAWEPPTRLAYTWHLGRDPDQATDVEIRFLPTEQGTTRVEVEHSGFDRFGDQADVWQARNRVGWDALVSPFSKAVEQSA